jgi:hypothetical protein
VIGIIEGRILKFIRLGPKRIYERAEDLIQMAMYWIAEGFDGVVFERCFCGGECGHFSAYYLKCGHSDAEGHFIKIVNDFCEECKKKMEVVKLAG